MSTRVYWSPQSTAAAGTVLRQGAIFSGVNPAATSGSTDNMVARFNGPTVGIGSLAPATWVTRTDDAVNGSTFEILQSGIYAAQFFVPLAAGQNAYTVVTVDATSAQRNVPALGAIILPTAVEGYGFEFVFASTLGGQTPVMPIPITAAMVAAPGQGIIRVLWGDPTGLPMPGAAIAVPADVNLELLRIGDIDE